MAVGTVEITGACSFVAYCSLLKNYDEQGAKKNVRAPTIKGKEDKGAAPWTFDPAGTLDYHIPKSTI